MLRDKPFWLDVHLPKRFDITQLRPQALPRGKRFETIADAIAESLRSERVIARSQYTPLEQEYLSECRSGYYVCEMTYCPICARRFRRWFIGEALKLATNSVATGQVVTILLAKSIDIDDLVPERYRSLIATRLAQSGFDNTPVLGGFEIVYRASDHNWVLHANLLIISDRDAGGLKWHFSSAEFNRPTYCAPLREVPEQLSYLLKFTTYHRPLRRDSSAISPAKPLNTRDHVSLVKWMAQFDFEEMIFLHCIQRTKTRLRAF
jgi:hypothetical protein